MAKIVTEIFRSPLKLGAATLYTDSMSKNDFITIPSRKEILALMQKQTAEPVVRETTLPVTTGEGFVRVTATERPSKGTLALTDFAKHTGAGEMGTSEIWLRGRGHQADTVQTYQAVGEDGPRMFTHRAVNTANVGVVPLLLNGDAQPFGTKQTKDGQTVLTIGNSTPLYPQAAAEPGAAACLDRNLIPPDDRHPATIGFKQVGTFTAPDNGRQCPCYRWHEQYFVLHTNNAGHTAWFRCSPIAVQTLNDQANSDLATKNVLFAAPFSSQQKFRERTQGAIANDELTLSQFSLGRFLQDTFLPELVKSTTFTLSNDIDMVAFTDRKLSRLNVTLRDTEQDNTQGR